MAGSKIKHRPRAMARRQTGKIMYISTNSGVSVRIVQDDQQTVIRHDTPSEDRTKVLSVILVESFAGTVRIVTHNDGTMIASLEGGEFPFLWQHDTHTLRITRIGE